MSRPLAVLLLCLLQGSVGAAYITDKLVAGLYEEAKVTDKPLRALPSGTPLEVISRDSDFIKVRTSDGVIGWVEATYLTDEKPARSILLDTQARLTILQRKLDTLEAMAQGETAENSLLELQQQLQQATANTQQLEEQLQTAREDYAQLQQRQAELDAVNAKLQGKLADIATVLDLPAAAGDPETAGVADAGQPASSASTSLGISNRYTSLPGWLSPRLLLVIMLLLLLTGLAGGYLVMRHRLRQRFGPMFRL